MRTILAFVLILGFAAAQETPAVAVIKAAIEAHGGDDALKKCRTAKSVAAGTMMVQGKEFKFSATAVYALPEKCRLEVVAEGSGLKIQATQIANGKKSKVSTKLNGTEQKNEAPADARMKSELAQAVLLQDITTLTPLLEPKKYTLKLDKDVDLNGNAASVVNVTGNNLREVKLVFDKKSHRLVKTQRRTYANGEAGVVEVNEETVLSDFKNFDKALLPTATLVTHDGKKFMSMTVSEFKVLEKVDDKEFITD